VNPQIPQEAQTTKMQVPATNLITEAYHHHHHHNYDGHDGPFNNDEGPNYPDIILSTPSSQRKVATAVVSQCPNSLPLSGERNGSCERNSQKSHTQLGESQRVNLMAVANNPQNCVVVSGDGGGGQYCCDEQSCGGGGGDPNNKRQQELELIKENAITKPSSDGCPKKKTGFIHKLNLLRKRMTGSKNKKGSEDGTMEQNKDRSRRSSSLGQTGGMMMMIMDTPITTRTCRGCEALIQRRTSQPGSKNNRAVSKDVTSPEESSSASRVIWMCQDERCPNYVGLNNRNGTKDAGGGGGGRDHFTNGRDSVDASGIGPFRINPQRVLFQDNKESSPTVDLRRDGKDLHNRSSMEVERVWISGKSRDICFLRCRNRQVKSHHLYFMF
jgi:hypothetical protein